MCGGGRKWKVGPKVGGRLVAIIGEMWDWWRLVAIIGERWDWWEVGPTKQVGLRLNPCHTLL